MLVLSKKVVKLATNESWTNTSIILLFTELVAFNCTQLKYKPFWELG